MFQRVMVALDGSALSEAVLPWVRRLLAETAAKVWLIHAVAPDPDWVWGYATLGQPMALPPMPPIDYRALGQAYLDRVAADLQGGDRLQTLVREGEPAPVLVAAATETDADVIAMCTHGRSGLARLVLGSVAERVLRGTTRPVLLIRPAPQNLRSTEDSSPHAGG